jgi:Rieske Fe-S protein
VLTPESHCSRGHDTGGATVGTCAEGGGGKRHQVPTGRGVSRRDLFRAVGVLVWASIAGAFGAMLQRLRARPAVRRIIVPSDLQRDITFVDTVIVSREETGAVRILSARCTHLGCQIDRVADGVLICPCHGSRFRPDGRVASGPAASPLVELPYEIDRTTGDLIVHVS